MGFKSAFLVLAALSAQSFAKHEQTTTHVVHERRADLLRELWVKTDRLDASAVLPVRIGMTQSNLQLGHELLMNMSDPTSPSYGQHMSSQEVIELFAPSNDSVIAVTRWLTSTGFEISRLAQSPNKQWIQFDASTLELEHLLHTQFHVWTHRPTGQRDIASEEYSIPAELVQHIDYITPGIRLHAEPNDKVRQRSATDEHTKRETGEVSAGHATCDKLVTPACLRRMYNISENTAAQHGNDLGFYEAQTNYYQPDFDKFTTRFYPRIPQGFKPTQYSIDGASLVYDNSSSGNADFELSLDTQTAMPIVYPQGFVIFNVPGGDSPHYPVFRVDLGIFLDAIDGSYCNYTADGITGDDPDVDPTYPDKQWPHQLQCGAFKSTNVISLSYATAEADYPASYMERQCSEYMKLGMQGITVVASSGDYGVGNFYRPISAKKANFCLGGQDDIFNPNFPASCPYVTTVGATMYVGADVQNHTLEHAALFSGGGFSNIFATPQYQKSMIEGFLTNHPPPYKSYSAQNNTGVGKNGGVFNRNGRGLPDIAAIGTQIPVYDNSSFSKQEGTSASTPIWAAIFTRLNGERLARGKSRLGFVNPALYANPQLMHDIVSGRNEGCDLNRTGGFNATQGWDPVTGLGSPSFPALVEYFSSL